MGRISFSKDGKHVVAAGDYETLIWNFVQNTHTLCEDENYNQLWAMAFDKSRELIYTGGDEGRVNVMDIDCNLLNAE